MKQDENKTEGDKEEIKQTEFEKIVCAKNEVPQKCGTCGSSLMIGGPIWNDKIHDIDFVKRMHETASADEAKKFGTIGRIKGILGGIIDEEWLAHKPLSYDLNQICSNLKVCNPTKNQIIAGFRSLDYMVTQTYYDPKLWKTNAPPEVVYDIIKAFKKQLCEKEGTEFMLNVHELSPMHAILAKPIEN